MIKQFKTNIALVYAFSIVFVAVASIGIFLSPSIDKYFFFRWYSGFLEEVEQNLILDYSLTLISVLLTGYFINRAFNKTSFYNKTTGFPMFVFVLIVSSLSGFYFEVHYIIDLLFAFLFLRIIDLDQNKSAIHVAFVSGVLLGISFLFSLWLIPVGLVVFYSLLTFRPFQWREWLVGFLGMALPALYLFSLRFLLLNNYTIKPIEFNTVSEQIHWYDYLSSGILVLIIIIAIFALKQQFKYQSNIERKQISILAFFTVVTFLISAGIYWFYEIEHFIFIVPLTILVSLPIVNIKQDRFLNILMISLVVINLLRIFVF